MEGLQLETSKDIESDAEVSDSILLTNEFMITLALTLTLIVGETQSGRGGC